MIFNDIAAKLYIMLKFSALTVFWPFWPAIASYCMAGAQLAAQNGPAENGWSGEISST